MKQDTSWMLELSETLRKKKDRRKDVFGNPLPTAYEAEHYPKAVAKWLESRKPFTELHASAKPTCDRCLVGNTPCRYPDCAPF